MRLMLGSGFVAAATLEWLLCALLHFRSGLPLLMLATIHIILVLVANVLGVGAAAHLLRQDPFGVAARSHAVVAWFAPLAVYWDAGSIWAVPLAALVTYNVAAILWTAEGPRQFQWPALVSSTGMFGLFEPPSLSRALWFFCAGLSLELALVTAAGRAIRLAIGCVCAGAAIVAYYSERKRISRKPVGPLGTAVSPLFTLILALILTSRGFGGGEGSSAAAGNARAPGEFNGVVLSPDTPKAIRLVAPPRPNSTGPAYGPRIPVRIPFNGVYWYFRFPEVRPPDDAVVAHGSPETLRFRSTDETPLIMEAHQHFDAPVDVTCCSHLDVEIANSEDRTSTVRLGVFVSDSAQTAKPVMLLGWQNVGPAREYVLHFAIPGRPSLAKFDDVTIRFQMDPETESAKIAVRYLVLVPGIPRAEKPP